MIQICEQEQRTSCNSSQQSLPVREVRTCWLYTTSREVLTSMAVSSLRWVTGYRNDMSRLIKAPVTVLHFHMRAVRKLESVSTSTHRNQMDSPTYSEWMQTLTKSYVRPPAKPTGKYNAQDTEPAPIWRNLLERFSFSWWMIKGTHRCTPSNSSSA